MDKFKAVPVGKVHAVEVCHANVCELQRRELDRLREELRLAKMVCEAAQEQTAALHNTENKEIARLRKENERYVLTLDDARGARDQAIRERDEARRYGERLFSCVTAEGNSPLPPPWLKHEAAGEVG